MQIEKTRACVCLSPFPVPGEVCICRFVCVDSAPQDYWWAEGRKEDNRKQIQDPMLDRILTLLHRQGEAYISTPVRVDPYRLLKLYPVEGYEPLLPRLAQ